MEGGLKAAIGKVGVHKVAMIESLVTPENESIMVEKLQSMSFKSIQVLSKELRNKEVTIVKNFNFDPNMQKLWNTVKKLMSLSDESDGIVLQKLLEDYVAKNYALDEALTASKQSRYVPSKQKAKIYKKFDGKCSHPNCTKPASEIHHQERYSAVKNHNNIVPLCKEHHELMHNSIIKNELAPVYDWELSVQKTTNLIDLKYQKMRN